MSGGQIKVSNCTTDSWMTVKEVKAISIVKFPSCPVTCAFSQSFVEPWCCKTLSEVLVVSMSKEVPHEEADGYSIECAGYSYEDAKEHLEVKSNLVIAQQIAG